MLPHTHFLVGLALGALAYRAGILPLWLAIVVGVVAMLIDLDHWIAYGRESGNWSMLTLWRHSRRVHESDRTFIHKPKGFLVMLLGIITLSAFLPVYGIALALAYLSHYFLDMAYVKYDYRIRGFGTSFPFSYYETVICAVSLIIIGLCIAF